LNAKEAACEIKQQELKMKDVLTFKDFTRGFHTQNPAATPKRRRWAPFDNITPEDKQRQLLGQVVGVIQELLNQDQLSSTDRRLLMLAGAVKLLLHGR